MVMVKRVDTDMPQPYTYAISTYSLEMILFSTLAALFSVDEQDVLRPWCGYETLQFLHLDSGFPRDPRVT